MILLSNCARRDARVLVERISTSSEFLELSQLAFSLDDVLGATRLPVGLIPWHTSLHPLYLVFHGKKANAWTKRISGVAWSGFCLGNKVLGCTSGHLSPTVDMQTTGIATLTCPQPPKRTMNFFLQQFYG